MGVLQGKSVYEGIPNFRLIFVRVESMTSPSLPRITLEATS